MKIFFIFLISVLIIGCTSLLNTRAHLWKSAIVNYANPIQKTESDSIDFSFMDKYLDSISYVFIGESSHEVEEYFMVRAKLIEYLCNKQGYSVVAFEHNKGSCFVGNSLRNQISNDSLFTYYYPLLKKSNNTPFGAISMLNYFEKKDIYTTGFDVLFSKAFFYNNIRNNLPDIPDSILALDSNYLYVNHSWAIHNVWKNILNDSSYFYNHNEYQSALYKEIANRHLWLSNLPNINPRLRDSIMAENIMWIIRKECPNKKIIFLAHNRHIDKSKNNQVNPMMSFISDSIKSKSYIIGLYAYQGTTGLRGSGSVELRKNTKASLGDILNSSGYEAAFCNLKGVKVIKENLWMAKKIPTLSWAFQTVKIVPNESFDGLIQIRNVHATHYNYNE